MVFLSLLIFFAGEVAAFVVVGQHVGFAWAGLILVAVSAAGPFIVRRVGFRVLARAQQRLAAGELPTGELLDGVVVLIGGLLICIPGFVGDAIGLMLMVPVLRRLLIRVAGARLARGVQGMETVRWSVVETRSFPVGGGSEPDQDGPPRRPLGPGE